MHTTARGRRPRSHFAKSLRFSGSLAAIGLASVVGLSACGGDDDGAASETAPAAEPGPEVTDPEPVVATTDQSDSSTDGGDDETAETVPALDADVLERLDANNDGQIIMGVAIPGPRDDGAFYQAMVDGIRELSSENGFAEPIIVDLIAPADAATELENLARSGADIIAVGAVELADSLPDVAAEFDDIFWYCNCGPGAAPNPAYAQATSDYAEINYAAGYATGLLMSEDDSADTATFIGNQGFNFEIESFLAFEAGLREINEEYRLTRVDTGSFNDVPAAIEAATSAIAAGTSAIYPYLGGAHEAVVALTNDNNVITMSAGASRVCERTDLAYQIAVKFDAADFVRAAFADILEGNLDEGDVRAFRVGVDPEVGATICDPTSEQQAAMDEVNQRIASGEYDELFGQIKAEAYGG